MNYPVTIDLKQLPLQRRNTIMGLVKKSRSYCRIENQVVSVDFNTASFVFQELSNANLSQN